MVMRRQSQNTKKREKKRKGKKREIIRAKHLTVNQKVHTVGRSEMKNREDEREHTGMDL
jgi:hypothetical protein